MLANMAQYTFIIGGGTGTGTVWYISFLHLVIRFIMLWILRSMPCSCKCRRPGFLWQLAQEKILAELLQLLCHL